MNELIQQVKRYVEIRLELLRISTAVSLIQAASSAATRILLGALLVSSLLMAELSLGLYLGTEFGDWSQGFLCIAGLNLLFFFLAVLLMKPIKRRIQDGLSQFVKEQ